MEPPPVPDGAPAPPLAFERFDAAALSDLRGSLFGHPGAIVAFAGGFIAKLAGPGESAFYESYESRLCARLPRDLVPEVLGLLYRRDRGGFDLQRSLRPPPGEARRPLLLQRDIAARFAQPAIIDLKLGDRSWLIGDPPATAARRAAKVAGGLCPRLFFRVRAAAWRGESAAFARVAGTPLSCVSRVFGNTCTLEQLRLLFRDFFRCRALLPPLVERLARLRDAVRDLRDAFDTRFYSSSVVVVYDSADPARFDLRMLDFEKSYVRVADAARRFGEPIESCEDHVAEAVENIRAMLLEMLVE
jgi:1D-myo-inositol-tetrakisphosphate 5-kinase/inositol-polyphosphate multikinase